MLAGRHRGSGGGKGDGPDRDGRSRRRFNPSHQWVHKKIVAGELKLLQMDVQTYFFRRSNMNALGKPRSWTDHLLWHHACHTVDLFQYQTGEAASKRSGAGSEAPESGHRHGYEHRHEDALGAICTLSLSFNNNGPLGTFFRYICDNGTYMSATTICLMARASRWTSPGVAVSMNGIELQDREFFSAIKGGREPNASVAQCLSAMRTLDKIEKSLK